MRHSKTISFITLTDGSNLNGLQIIADSNLKNYEQLIPKLTTGTAISISGKIIQSPGKEQSIEMFAKKNKYNRYLYPRNISSTEKASFI